ncbi:hypothetical protein Bca101_049183 [Brassica carinata]
MEESQCDGIGGHHKLKTRVINSNCNPVWNEQLTLSIKHLDDPIRLSFLRSPSDGVKIYMQSRGSVQEGPTVWLKRAASLGTMGKVKQDTILRLKNGERGEMEIMLEWTDGPGYKDLMIQEDTMDATKRLD